MNISGASRFFFPPLQLVCWNQIIFIPLLLFFFARKERINFNILFYFSPVRQHIASVDFWLPPGCLCLCDGWLDVDEPNSFTSN